MNEAPDHRKVYARGYFDAMRSIGFATEGKTMQQVKADSMYSSMNGMLKKVYDAVPMSDPWTSAQIHDEVRRHGSASDSKSVRGCLNSLLGMGLVREPSTGTFVRVEIKAKPQKPVLAAVPTVETKSEITPEVKKEVGPMDTLGALSSRVLQLAEAMKTLAGDIDSVAIEIAEQAEKVDVETEKVRQLKALLKSLG